MTTFTGDLTPTQAGALEHLTEHPRSVLVGTEADHLPAIAALVAGLAEDGRLRRPAFGMDEFGRESALRPLPILWLAERAKVTWAVARLSDLRPSLEVVSAITSVDGDREDRAMFEGFLERYPTGVDCIVATPQLADNRRALFELLEPGLVVVGDAWALKAGGARHQAVTWLSEASERVVVISPRGLETMTPIAAWATVSAAGLPGVPNRSEFTEQHVVWQRAAYGRRDLWRDRDGRAEFLASVSPYVLGGIALETAPAPEAGDSGR